MYFCLIDNNSKTSRVFNKVSSHSCFAFSLITNVSSETTYGKDSFMLALRVSNSVTIQLDPEKRS